MFPDDSDDSDDSDYDEEVDIPEEFFDLQWPNPPIEFAERDRALEWFMIEMSCRIQDEYNVDILDQVTVLHRRARYKV